MVIPGREPSYASELFSVRTAKDANRMPIPAAARQWFSTLLHAPPRQERDDRRSSGNNEHAANNGQHALELKARLEAESIDDRPIH